MDQDEFDSKLKQARRLKETAEEELETAEERWRSEKRRLNSEINRLETALAEAKNNSRPKAGVAGTKDSGVDPAKLQAAADEKMKKATDEWNAERARLTSQVNRLEGAVAEAIARSSNPMRATQSVKEQFEAQLDRLAKEKTEIEQAFLRGKTEWEQEKLKMTGEMVKLRRAAQIMGKVVPREDAPEINPKVRDLENQLKEALAKWNAERQNLVNEIQKMEAASRQWDTERRQLNDHAAQLQQAFVHTEAKMQGYEVASRTGNQSDVKLEELRKQKETLEQEFQDARNTWDSERRHLNSLVERMEQQVQRVSVTHDRVSTEVVDQLRQQYEQKLHAAIEQKTQLAQQLQSASALLESGRARLAAQIRQGEGTAVNKEAIAAEVARVQAMIQQVIALIDDPSSELSLVIRKNVEKAELDAYLKGILFSIGQGGALK